VSEPVDVTVSIVNHEHRDAVLAQLAHLRDDATRTARIEVVVVDNASQDGSAAAIADAFPEVRVLARRDRAGYGANHNAAARDARGRHLLLLNDDTLVEPGAIDALCAALDADPAVAVAAPTVVTASSAIEPTLWRRPAPWVDVVGALRFGRPPAPRLRGDGPHDVGWATGCALLVRRSALEAVGRFDEGYFMYSEEVDLCTRLADRGGATRWVPSARVTHEGQGSTGAMSPARAVEMARSRRRYWHRHYSTAGRVAAQAATGAMFLAMAGSAVVRRTSARPYLLQAWGCWAPARRAGLREAAAAFNRTHGIASPVLTDSPDR
jgi:GT2 family glycosyltransferase